MKEWILENLDWLVPLVSGLLSGSSICSIITLVRGISFDKALKKAKESKYYTTCPHCKKKVYLDELFICMPDGALDNNLNGTPDHLE